MAESILVVEDEAHVRELVSYTLQGAGYQVEVAADGESALREAAARDLDLIVLDIRLPGIDGWEVCRRVREHGNTPILFLTALSDDEQMVRGLRLGADDYVRKPFSPAVLAARVQALLRRSGKSAAVRVVRLRGLSIDLSHADVRRRGKSIHLTPIEFRVLAALTERVGQVLDAGELIRAVHGHDLPEQAARGIVKVHIRHLRSKLEPQVDRPRYVLTVRGRGYMLNRNELEEVT